MRFAREAFFVISNFLTEIIIEICYTNQNCINNGEAVPIIDAILVYMLLF